MQKTQIQALFLIIFSVVNAGIIQVPRSPLTYDDMANDKEAEQRRLGLGYVGIGLAGFLSGYLLGKYMKSKRPVKWGDDQAWEQRFLQIAKTDNLTLEFMNLILDNFALDLSNACIKTYQSRFEDFQKLTKADKKLEDEEKRTRLFLAWQAKTAKMEYCSDFFKFITSHGFITKYMLDAKYASFYFAQSFMGIQNQHLLNHFLNELATDIRVNPLYKQIEEAHQNYFYITVNYFLDSQMNLLKIKELKKKL